MTKEEYLNSGNECPHCKSEDIEIYDREFPGNLTQDCKLKCFSCGKKWTEHYKLINITLDEQNTTTDCSR